MTSRKKKTSGGKAAGLHETTPNGGTVPPDATQRKTAKAADDVQPSARFTLITATAPAVVSKAFRLVDGKLVKTTAANVYDGHAAWREVGNLTEFGQVLSSLTPAQALVYGCAAEPEFDLTTKKAWDANGRPDGQAPRSKEVLPYRAQPGVLCLDHDAPDDGAPLTRDQFVAAIRTSAPGLADAELLTLPSAGSMIVNGATGETLRGLLGQRGYLIVQDATDIPRAGRVICDRAWAAGHGRFAVSSAGTLLERGLIDLSVFQGNHVDFAGGAVCHPPLVQQRGDPVLIAGVCKVVDTKIALPDLDPAAERLAAASKDAARALVKDRAREARSAWMAVRVEQGFKSIKARSPGTSDEDARAQAAATVEEAIGRQMLTGGFEIDVRSPDGKIVSITIAQILADRKLWHGCATRDPIEGIAYQGGRLVGTLYLAGPRLPSLYSHAHGGQRYDLIGQRDSILIQPGALAATTDLLIGIFRKSDDFFDFGEALVRVDGGALLPLVKDITPYLASRVVQFTRLVRRGKGAEATYEEVNVDPPVAVCASMLALGATRRLKPLRAVVTAPLMRPDGSILCVEGYDAETQLFLDLAGEDMCDVPLSPTPSQLRAAFAVLWAPFAQFPFVGDVDRGVFLASLLTAVQRVLIDVCPAFGFDANTQGSGKTTLCECLAIISSNAPAKVWPHTNDEAETRKRVLTALLSGARSLIWDNAKGTVDSASLAALVTGAVFTDRILGVTADASVPNRMLLCFSGNNFSATGELTRRIFISRLDAKVADPYTRRFSFAPKEVCLEQRQKLVAASLTLLRGHRQAGQPIVDERASGFPQWDTMVRQAVLWVAKHVAPESVRIGDPLDSLLDTARHDSTDGDLRELIDAWLSVFGSKEISVRALLKIHEEHNHFKHSSVAEKRRLADALEAFGRDGRPPTAQSLGLVLKYRRDRVMAGTGLRIERRGQLDGIQMWRVAAAAQGSSGPDAGGKSADTAAATNTVKGSTAPAKGTTKGLRDDEGF